MRKNDAPIEVWEARIIIAGISILPYVQDMPVQYHVTAEGIEV